MLNLLVLFLIPFVAAIGLLGSASISKRNQKCLAILLSLIPLGLLIYGHTNWIGSEAKHAWFPAASVEFYLKIDQLSLVFLYLTAIVIPISLFAMRSSALAHAHVFYGLILLLQGLLIGLFTARDLVLFTLFFEAVLIPIYFMMVYWGGSGRQRAAMQFLIYMISGSVLMVAAMLGIYVSGSAKTFDLDLLVNHTYAPWICAVFLLAFAVKTPLFPFHAWLPDAYYEAPVSGTILLSAILSKAGIYGFLRIALELFPTYMKEWSPLLLGLAIAGVFYGGLNAWAQNDYKRLLAYSSFSHVNFVLAGIFIWNQVAHAGAILQAFNHGITIAALFLVAGWLQERLGSTSLGSAGGMAKYLPLLCWVTLFFVLASVALPGLNNFVGELMIFFGLFGQRPWLTAFLGLTIILSVIYMLRFMQKIYFENPNTLQKNGQDLKFKDFVIVLPLMGLMLWIGFYPAPILRQIVPAAEKTIDVQQGDVK